MKKVFIALAAFAALCSCQKDPAGNVAQWTGGDEAYLSIKISDGTQTKADTPSDDFRNGIANEHAVVSAKFYFYDKAGVYVAEANVWNGGSPTAPNQNIEFEGKSVVILKGLTGKSFPNYVVTVLNAPAGFVPGETLDVMETKLAGGIYRSEPGEEGATVDYFTMSTTSYAGQKDVDGNALPYFVTEVKEENFAKEPVAAEIAKPVVIYVERLAAKVTLEVANTLKPAANGLYKMNVTVSGNLNDEGSVEGENGSVEVGIGATDIYIKFLGWDLNATAVNSYMMKNIDESWSSDNLGFNWNDAANFRSYWGKSYIYGDENYADNLVYKSANELNKTVGAGSVAYCPENTNTAVLAAKRDALTSVLLKAQICDENGGPLTDLVRFNGVLYTGKSFCSYVLNSTEGLPYYKITTADDVTKYVQIDAKYVELVAGENGNVYVQLKNEGLPALYNYTAGAEDPYTEITDLSTVNELLKSFEETHGEASGYKEGLMYYNIPIQHLRRPLGDEVLEANYGVVRNHMYVITIDKLLTIGKGIFDPDEKIVPKDTDDKESYYVGAQINILSWKIVSQNVSL